MKRMKIPSGKLFFCNYCRNKFYQQGSTVFYDSDGKQYINCPYCRDHKIYTGVVRKLVNRGITDG